MTGNSGPWPGAYTLEFPKLKCVGTGPRPGATGRDSGVVIGVSDEEEREPVEDRLPFGFGGPYGFCDRVPQPGWA